MKQEVGYTKLAGKLQRQTEKAYLIHITKIEDRDLDVPISKWIPLSQIVSDIYDTNGEGEFMVANWLVDKLELE
jgi:hypothetical protein